MRGLASTPATLQQVAAKVRTLDPPPAWATEQGCHGWRAQAYAAYAPYQFLAYWWELCKHYQEAYATPFYALAPEQYALFSAAKLRKGARQPRAGPGADAGSP